MRRLSLWMRARPMVGDSLVAVLLGMFTVLMFFAARSGGEFGTTPWWVVLPLDLVAVAPLVFRRRHPLWAAYTILVVGIPDGFWGLAVGSGISTALMVYTVVVYVSRRHGALYFVLLVLLLTGQLLIEPSEDIVAPAVAVVLGLALCWVLGEFAGARRAYQLEVEARLHLLETERDQAARIAVAEERGRIARELHDVVAHAVSVMVVQADGASYAIRSNPELAERALTTISETGRGALAELRRLLDVLRNEQSDGEPRVPQPNAAAIVELAARVREAGLVVDLEIDDDLGELPAGVSLGVYRIVQESLTNAIKHAGPGTRTKVQVFRGEQTMHVEVTDDGGGKAGVNTLVPASGAASVPGGNGLIGMRERANVFGGWLDVGPADGGGWRVRAELPVRLSS